MPSEKGLRLPVDDDEDVRRIDRIEEYHGRIPIGILLALEMRGPSVGRLAQTIADASSSSVVKWLTLSAETLHSCFCPPG